MLTEFYYNLTVLLIKVTKALALQRQTFIMQTEQKNLTKNTRYS